MGGTGFEPVTSAMSTQHSNQSELTALITHNFVKEPRKALIYLQNSSALFSEFLIYFNIS